MKGILEILLLINLIKGCPLKKKTSSMKRCYKTYSKTSSTYTSSKTDTTFTDTTFTDTISTDTTFTDTTFTDTISTDTTFTDTTFTDTTFTDTTSTDTTSTSTTTTSPTNGVDNIPITTGKNATLTYFTDTVTQCYGGDIPDGNGLAVNPLLLGFTLSDWNTKYSNVDSNSIPWCGKMMNVTVNNKTYSARIIDTCNPGDEGAFIDPNTGLVIGGKCDYMNVIDLYGEPGLQFLQSTVGDDFYQGDLEWVIY
jgi:hypothetical protein